MPTTIVREPAIITCSDVMAEQHHELVVTPGPGVDPGINQSGAAGNRRAVRRQ